MKEIVWPTEPDRFSETDIRPLKIKYPRIKFWRDDNGKLINKVQVLVELDEKDETLDLYSPKEIKQIFKEQKREER